jgi:nicotinamidase/pyrazinamidase
MKKALVIVDVQHDFCPKGALPVKDGDKIVPIINSLISKFNITVTTQDWHPKDHVSFSDQPKYQDGSWPAHCIKETIGAQIHIGLQLKPENIFVHKGQDKEVEEYSGFEGFVYNYLKELKLHDKEAKYRKYGPSDRLAVVLDQREVDEVYICGLATDYCVKATALSSIKEGFNTFVVLDACRGVFEDTTEAAIKEMERAGVQIVESGNLNVQPEPEFYCI